MRSNIFHLFGRIASSGVRNSLGALVFLLAASCQHPVKDARATSAITSAGLIVPDGLEATLWAESPMLNNPTNIDVDARGRIWVTEAVNYRNYNNDSTKFLHRNDGDRVVILEDRDQDGKADTAITFVQDKDLRSPLGIAVFGNKVVVSCSPYLIVYTDEDGDDHADKKEIFLKGFGGYDHDHSLHAVFGGPDGNWYFNTGNAGPHHVTDHAGWTLRSGSLYTGGSPYNKVNHGNQRSDDGKVWVGGLALRISPEGTGLKVMGHNFRNSYEVCPDSYGNLWQNDNDDQVVTCRTSWLMEGGNAGYFSTDGTRFWQSDQRPGQDIFAAHWHQDDPGVMPAGDRTGAGAPTGIVRIETAELGSQYRGMLLSADAGRNVIFGYSPVPDRSGYDLGKRQDLITSLTSSNEGYVYDDSASNAKKESWFRPSDVAIGTEGAIYVADWYDPLVGGHAMQDKKGVGRIYRIALKGRRLVCPKLDLQTPKGLVEAFKNPAVNVRFTAANLLVQQSASASQSRSVFESGPVSKSMSASFDIIELAKGGDPFLRARSIWLLSRMGKARIAEVEKQLADPSPEIRATAFRALRQTGVGMIPYIEKLLSDTSAFVRRELLIALADQPGSRPVNQRIDPSAALRKKYLLSLARSYTGNDRWYLNALGSAMQSEAGYWYKLLKDSLYTDAGSANFGSENSGRAKSRNPHVWSSEMADLAWCLHPAEAVQDLAERIRDSSLAMPARIQSLTALAFVNSKAAAVSMLAISQNQPGELGSTAKYWLAFRKDNDWYAYLPWAALNKDLYKEKKIAQMKVNWQMVMDSHQSAGERNSRLERMLKDSTGGQMLLDLVAGKKVPAEWMKAIGTGIFDNPDPGVRLQATRYFTKPANKDVLSPEKILALKGDAAQGKGLFTAHCSSCHKAGETGGNIGPDLTGIGKKLAKAELLNAVLDPDASIVFGYEPLLVKEKSGMTVFGFLVSEDDRLLVVKDLAGKRNTIAKKDIVERQKQQHSLMPSASSMQLKPEEMASILAFLQGVK